MSKTKYFCRKITLSDSGTGEIISEKTFDPPRKMDFDFPCNIDMELNNVRCGTYSFSPYNEIEFRLKGEQ